MHQGTGGASASSSAASRAVRHVGGAVDDALLRLHQRREMARWRRLLGPTLYEGVMADPAQRHTLKATTYGLASHAYDAARRPVCAPRRVVGAPVLRVDRRCEARGRERRPRRASSRTSARSGDSGDDGPGEEPSAGLTPAVPARLPVGGVR